LKEWVNQVVWNPVSLNGGIDLILMVAVVAERSKDLSKRQVR
jgi:hypothetical protein